MTSLHQDGQALLVDFAAMVDALQKNSDKPRDVIRGVAERLNRRILENKTSLTRLADICDGEQKILVDRVIANLALNYVDFLAVLRSVDL